MAAGRSVVSHDNELRVSDECAKKPPERPRPRGAKDTTLFRERLEGSIAAWHGHPARDLPLSPGHLAQVIAVPSSEVLADHDTGRKPRCVRQVGNLSLR